MKFWRNYNSRRTADKSSSASGRAAAGTVDVETLSPGARNLLKSMEPYPLSIDVLGRTSGCSAGDIPGLLLELELAGIIRQLPGQLYELAG